MPLRFLALAVLLVAATARPSGQAEATAPRFEVASIKENRTISNSGMLAVVPGGGVTARHARGVTLITYAYGLRTYELIGAPRWLGESYYDISAKPAAQATRDESLAMLRSLIAERFKLRVHREQRTLSGYALTRQDDRRLGPSIKPSALDCVKEFVAACRDGYITENSLKHTGLPMANIIGVLVSRVGDVPVVDETGLQGTWDAELRWSTDASPLPDAPTIFTAVQEQLGLRLRSGRFSHEVVVIDHVEPPTPD